MMTNKRKKTDSISKLSPSPRGGYQLVACGTFAANQVSTVDMMATRALWRGEDSCWFLMAHGRCPAILSWTAVSQGLGFLGKVFPSQPGAWQ